MRFHDDPEEATWRSAVRAFLAENLSAGLLAELKCTNGRHGGPEELTFLRMVAEQGWYGLNWPSEFGGLEKRATEQLILIEEFDYAGAPPLPTTVTSIGPTLIIYGSPASKRELLPRMVSGECTFALAYSEPDAGTDLASLRTKAVRDGEEWVISGEKVWCSYAHFCTHFWLAVRTGTPESRHRGISLFIVPRDLDGIHVSPLWTWGDVRTNQVVFDSVRVSASNLVGEVNGGWECIRAALSFERVSAGTSGRLRRLLDDVRDYSERTYDEDELLANSATFRLQYSEFDTELEIAHLMGLRTAQAIDDGLVPQVEASMQKILVTELQTEISAWAMAASGLSGQLDKADDAAPLNGSAEWMFREAPYLRFGGGTNEIQRNIVAQQGLGLPR